MVSTRGAISRTGQICSSITHERSGPICRSMTDLALMLTYMVGFDAEDQVTANSLGRLPTEPYTAFLNKGALKGARLGVLRSLFRGSHEEYAEGYRLTDEAMKRLTAAGAILVDPVGLDFDLPEALADASVSSYERKPSHNWYLSRLPADAPIHSVDEMIAKAGDIVKPVVKESNALPPLDHYEPYLARLKQQQVIREAVIAMMDRYQLDALIYPFKVVPPAKIQIDAGSGGGGSGEGSTGSANISARTGLPALCAPAGLTKEGLPISLQFLGRPWSEPKLIALGYAYEQASPARQPPPNTPVLTGETVSY
jgi:amidase